MSKPNPTPKGTPKTLPKTPGKAPVKQNPDRHHETVRLTADQVREVIPGFRETGASLPQARFAAEYLTNGFNASAAYVRTVSGSAKGPRATAMGSAWLRAPEVQECIRQWTAAFLSEKRTFLEKSIIETLFAQAFYDPSTFIGLDGEPVFKTWEEIPAPLRKCVEGIETKYYGKDATRSAVIIKLVDRSKALDRLASYISLMKGTGLPTDKETAVTPDTEMLLQSVFAQATPTGFTKDPIPMGEVGKRGK